MVTAVGYHLMISGARLRSRARKVVDIEAGNASRLFHEVDIDSNDHITRKELTSFLGQSVIWLI